MGFRREIKQTSFKWPQGIFKKNPMNPGGFFRETENRDTTKEQREGVLVEVVDLMSYETSYNSEDKSGKVGKMTEAGMEMVKEKYGEAVPDSMGGNYIYSMETPLWTVRQKGRGGMIRIDEGRMTKEAHVRPILNEEGPLVQSAPRDYYKFLKERGIAGDTIMKASALGWSIKTGGAIISSVIETLKAGDQLMQGNAWKKDWVMVG